MRRGDEQQKYNTMIKRKFIDGIRALLNRFDVDVVYHSEFRSLKANETLNDDLAFLLAMPAHQTHALLSHLKDSASQFRQDLFVLAELGFKRNGYFVEFGATNGLTFSNSLLLENSFGWTGILAEPARSWHKALHTNRRGPIETRCVWKDSNTVLQFSDIPESGLSHISGVDTVHRDPEPFITTSYEVESISLNDLLDKYRAPRAIDYLSIDTEGSEFDILSNFDFTKHHIQVITCEHNMRPDRERIFDLLSKQGYERKLEGVSNVDDWYVHQK